MVCCSTFTVHTINSITAPRFGNLSALIDRLFGPATRLPGHVLVHRCFPRRVLHKILSSLDGDPEPTCGPLCTPDSDPPPAPARRNPSPEINLLSDSDDEVQHSIHCNCSIKLTVRILVSQSGGPHRDGTSWSPMRPLISILFSQLDPQDSPVASSRAASPVSSSINVVLDVNVQ